MGIKLKTFAFSVNDYEDYKLREAIKIFFENDLGMQVTYSMSTLTIDSWPNHPAFNNQSVKLSLASSDDNPSLAYTVSVKDDIGKECIFITPNTFKTGTNGDVPGSAMYFVNSNGTVHSETVQKLQDAFCISSANLSISENFAISKNTMISKSGGVGFDTSNLDMYVSNALVTPNVIYKDGMGNKYIAVSTFILFPYE